VTLCCCFLQIEALFDLIKGLIKDMDGAQDDEVRPYILFDLFVIFFPLLSAIRCQSCSATSAWNISISISNQVFSNCNYAFLIVLA
jgi:hypothetical protein